MVGLPCPAALLLALSLHPAAPAAEPTAREAEAQALDRKVLAEVKAGSEVLANLTYL
jgi:hypothetical protein